ncbi:outer membrane pore protein [Shigella sonnei]|nr:outer membrane pore protein [Shigella sonnei]
MTILNKNWPVEFPFPTVIRTVVCSDLDETYIPSDSDKKKLGGVVQLESWICPYISRHLLSLNPLQARCRRYSRGER